MGPETAARRPRDELGRPLAWGDTDRLGLPDFDANTPERNHAMAVGAFNEGRYFAAHEAWETVWKQVRESTDDGEFFKGLAQLGAGYVHLLRGNTHGAVTLLGRARDRLAQVASPHAGVDTAYLVARCDSDIEALATGLLRPGPAALEGDRPFLDAPSGGIIGFRSKRGVT